MRGAGSVGLYLAVVQFFFALSWIVYVIYLPQLAERAGLPRSVVPWLLMLDQLLFIVCDTAVGFASDRAAQVLGKVGRWMIVATLVSMAAFVALPFGAPGGPVLLTLLTVVWAISSSVLRAPPLTLLGRYVAKPTQPLLVALMLLGSGIAAAVAPYLGLVLKQIDPRWPFALSSLALAAVVVGMVAAERALARSHAVQPAPKVVRTKPLTTPIPGFLLAALLAAAAFQLHANVLSAPLYLRHAAAAELPWLMPVFWVGFNLALLPASLLTKRYGSLAMMAAGAFAAAGCTLLAWAAGSLPVLLAAQGLAGASWAVLLMSGFASALWFGHVGREGLLSGAMNALLAGAALARLGLVVTVAPAPAVALGWGWVPALGFVLGAALLAVIWQRSRA
ncbi:MFS transporter [Aquincola sp. S2]|uniref:MFS transporter n=1 Tax=Pseudaquabacterium terrae TaxID=2732868 RepID=A0ABX2EJX7_9BURK|nr:MFS transporter [Aquabacterium terrae]NRF68844.1 MFS transporter [Aquabacterium terrae]